MSVVYRFNDPGAGLTVRVYQANTIAGTKTLVDSVVADTLPTVSGKLQWSSLLADPAIFSWLASWDGVIEGPYSVVIPGTVSLGTIDIVDMVPRLIGDVPGASRFIIIDALRKTIRDFCVRTQMWQYEQPEIIPVEGQQDYILVEPKQTEICSIYDALQRTAPEPMTPRYTLPPTELKGNLASLYGRPARALMSVFPLPSANSTDPFIVTVSLQPTLEGMVVDKVIHERWEDTFLAGARGRLLAMLNKPWTDMNMATYNRSIYETDLYDALAEMVKGGTNEVTTTNYPEYF